MRYEWCVVTSSPTSDPAQPRPTILLLSTSDTDLITARASGAGFRWANPSRLVTGELEELLDGADIAVIRILGGYRAWQDGIDTVVASGLPTVVVSGLFFFILRSILRADRTERRVYARIEAEEWAKRGLPPASEATEH